MSTTEVSCDSKKETCTKVRQRKEKEPKTRLFKPTMVASEQEALQHNTYQQRQQSIPDRKEYKKLEIQH